MCGVFGIFDTSRSISEDVIRKALSSIRHRGPDSDGVWLGKGVGIGHARLAIQDITHHGHQPMHSKDGRYVISYNGEIYNTSHIKKELPSAIQSALGGHSDTEVILAAIQAWGIDRTLHSLRGMFAFALWDTHTDTLYLARDRFGEKPMYYGQVGSSFVFSSELKAIYTAFPDKLSLNMDTVCDYLRYSYVPTPRSIYEGVHKLQPGHYLTISGNKAPQLKAYWSAHSVVHSAKGTFTGSFDEASRALEKRLLKVVDSQMISDVPLGAFLSGGIDSSVIVALMQSISSSKVNTFSIGFDNPSYNEAEYAQAVATHIGTDHTNFYISDKMACDVIPGLPKIYDEPFADSSQIPTVLVSQLARSKVTVALTGDSGDELFGGYNRYVYAERIKKSFLQFPKVSQALFKLFTPCAKLVFTKGLKRDAYYDKFMKLRALVESDSGDGSSVYKQLCSQYHDPEQLLVNKTVSSLINQLPSDNLTYEEWMMLSDTMTYMTDDILTKVDRAAMASSLETRVPFLDHELFEFAWSLPIDYKIKKGMTKRVLRDVLYRHVPQALVDRPKMGFAVPLASWLRGGLKDWAASLLDVRDLANQGILCPIAVTKLWDEHQSGNRNWQGILWNILMLQSWLKEYPVSL